MGVRLKDIPFDPLSPEEVEALSNETFDYADRENVSLREANRVIEEETQAELFRNAMMESNKAFGTNFDVTNPNYDPGTLDIGPGDFTFGQKTLEVAKAGHRGLGSLVKLPGILLKAVGEGPTTRADRAKLRAGSAEARRQNDPVIASRRKFADMLRRTGNRYIETVNSMTYEESLKSKIAREQSFSTAPVFRTAISVAESAPSYGSAVAASIATGNPNVGLYLLGATTASSAYETYREQGVDPELALLGAAIEGSIEVITEKVPMDELMKGGGRKFLVRALRLGTAESFQELMAQLGQNYTSAVVKDVDPENYATVFNAAKQEWSVISKGWQDSMAAGFFMGGGAAAFSGNHSDTDFGFRTKEEMKSQYGVSPRNMNELLYLHDQIKNQVRAIEKATEKPAEGETQTGKINTSDVPKIGLTVEEQTSVDQLVEKGMDPAEADRLTRASSEVLGGDIPEIEPSELDKVEAQIQAERTGQVEDIGEGEELTRGSSLSVLAQAIEDDMVEENADVADELPTYRAMNMAEQAQKVAKLISDDIKLAKRIAFYEEAAPPGIYPENVYTGLRTYSRVNLDVILIMELALNEQGVTGHTVLGKRVKSLDTGQDNADPVQAVKEVADARKEKMGRDGKDIPALEDKLKAMQIELDTAQKALGDYTKKAKREYGKTNSIVTKEEYEKIIGRRNQEISEMRHGRNLGAAYIPNAQDFIDLAKIATYHLEATGRNFAKWSAQVTKDMGEWVSPHLKTEFDKAFAEVGEKISKDEVTSALDKLKKRLETQIKNLEKQIESGELTKKKGKEEVSDAEVVALRARLEATQKQFASVFEKELGDKKIDSAIKLTEKSIKELGRKIKAGDTSTKTRKKLSSPELDNLKAEQAELRKELKGLRDAKKTKKTPEEIALQAKKSRLKSGTKKFDAKLKSLDFERQERAEIELDAEGQSLQDAYDLAKEKYKAAQSAQGIITEEEVRIIATLAKDVAVKKAEMENGKRRKQDSLTGTPKERAYGVALSLYNEYVKSLKTAANKRTILQSIKEYLTDPGKFVSDTFGVMKNTKAAIDNSFIGRQGLKAFLKGITGDLHSLKIWTDTLVKSFKVMWGAGKTGKNKKMAENDARRMIYADIVSDPDYKLLKTSKTAIGFEVIEEDIPVDFAEKLPIVGVAFRVSDEAFSWSAKYMRYALAKNYMRIWRKSGRPLNKKNLIDIGRLTNSQTGRGGDAASRGGGPGIINNVFFSPKMLRAHLDTLTLHLFDKNFSKFARLQAAKNLVQYISGAAMILAIAKWIDDDSVTFDTKSSDFGKIRAGNTRFSVGGGLEIFIILASRLAQREFTSASTGKTKSIDTGRFGSLGGKELVFNFLENKLSPGASFVLMMADQVTRDGDKVTIPQMLNKALTPIIIETAFQSKDQEDAANILAVILAEAFGVGVNTFDGKFKKKKKKDSERYDL
jgi:hypothetical protein